MHISLLTEDYLKPSGRFVRVFEGRSMEAPAVFKHQGRYYLMASGCTGWAPNEARSAVPIRYGARGRSWPIPAAARRPRSRSVGRAPIFCR